MKVLIIIIVAVILGLIYRSVSGSPQQASSSRGVAVPDKWKEWFRMFKWEYLGWLVFALVVLDLSRKFVFPSVPVELKQWIPGFSWNTFEILAVLVGVYFLWNKWGKKEDDGNETKKGGETKKETPKKMSPLSILIAAAALGAVAYVIYEYQLAHVGELATSVNPGYFYIPLPGLLFAFSVMAVTTLLDKFTFTGFLTGTAFYVVFLPVGIYLHWFMPHVGDILIPFWGVLLGVGGAFIPILRMSPTDWFIQQSLMGYVPITAAAVFVPQMFLW